MWIRCKIGAQFHIFDYFSFGDLIYNFLGAFSCLKCKNSSKQIINIFKKYQKYHFYITEDLTFKFPSFLPTCSSSATCLSSFCCCSKSSAFLPCCLHSLLHFFPNSHFSHGFLCSTVSTALSECSCPYCPKSCTAGSCALSHLSLIHSEPTSVLEDFCHFSKIYFSASQTSCPILISSFRRIPASCPLMNSCCSVC